MTTSKSLGPIVLLADSKSAWRSHLGKILARFSQSTSDSKAELQYPPHLLKSDIDLLNAYAQQGSREARVAFAFAHPRLLSPSTLLALQSDLQKQKRATRTESMEYLVELDTLRYGLGRNPNAYALGGGPIEKVWTEYHTGKLSLESAIEKVGNREFSEQISPVYVHAVQWQVVELGKTQDWRRGVVLCRLLSEAVLAGDETLPIGGEVRDTVTGLVRLAILAFARGIDDILYSETLKILGRLVARAERTGDSKLLGVLLHTQGTLYSDHYTDPVAFEPKTNVRSIHDWLRRRGVKKSVFAGLPRTETYPPPVEALRIAIDLYQQALPLRTGLQKGLTYKAIAQTLLFLSEVLKQSIDDGLLRAVVLQARALLSKHPDPSHMETINRIISKRGYVVVDLNRIADREVDGMLTRLAEPSRVKSAPDPESHNRALEDLRRAIAHRLPFALYLRNFGAANEIHQVGKPFATESPGEVQLINPQVSYSVIDHKLLSVFPEGVVGVSDPSFSSFWSRQTLIPMLSLSDSDWKATVSRLISLADRIAVLLDEITPGVLFELNELVRLRAVDKTFIFTGQAYRSGKKLPDVIASGTLKYVGDWLDASYNETYHDYRHKAHAIVQGSLVRFLTPRVQETAVLFEDWRKGRSKVGQRVS